MEALFSQLTLLANQALDDKDFDPSRLDDLLRLFEQEAYSSWAAAEAEQREAEAAMKEAEDYLDSLMAAAMADSLRSFHETERSADEAKKAAQDLGAAAEGASERYVGAALASAMATMKAALAATKLKVHPS